MAIDLSGFVPLAASGIQGYLQGRQAKLQEDQIKQLMALKEAAEMRESAMFPLQQRQAEVGIQRGEREISPVSGAYERGLETADPGFEYGGTVPQEAEFLARLREMGKNRQAVTSRQRQGAIDSRKLQALKAQESSEGRAVENFRRQLAGLDSEVVRLEGQKKGVAPSQREALEIQIRRKRSKRLGLDKQLRDAERRRGSAVNLLRSEFGISTEEFPVESADESVYFED